MTYNVAYYGTELFMTVQSFIVDATAYYTIVYLTRIGKFYSTDPKCNLIKFVSEIPEQCRYVDNKLATTKLFN